MSQLESFAPPDPGCAADIVTAFWTAAGRIAAFDGDRSDDPTEAAAGALVELAALGAETELREILRPDPARDTASTQVTWTVACFEIGYIAPVESHEIAAACDAIEKLTRCDVESHVASELICTDGNDLQWIAIVRSDDRLAIQLPDPGNLSAPDPNVAVDAVSRWRGRVGAPDAAHGDAVGPESGAVIDLAAIERSQAHRQPVVVEANRPVADARSLMRAVGTMAKTKLNRATRPPDPSTDSDHAERCARLEQRIDEQAETIDQMAQDLLALRAEVEGADERLRRLTSGNHGLPSV